MSQNEPSDLDTDDALGAELSTLADVEPEELRWLWNQRIPYGKLTDLAGDPGEGKSLLSLRLAAAVSTGNPLPQDSGDREPQDVLLLSAEDGLADTIRPRLEVMDADPDRVHQLKAVQQDGDPEPVNLSRDGHPEQIRRVVEGLSAGLVVIDPLTAYLGGTGTNSDSGVRSVLRPLADLADATGAAVVMIRHLRKAKAKKAIYRPGGSIGLTAAVRSQLLVGHSPSNPNQHAIVQTKTNLGKQAKAIGFTIEGTDEDVPELIWTGTSRLTAEDLLSADDGSQERSELDRAKLFLRQYLGDGARKAEGLKEEAVQAGISHRTLRRASEELDVQKAPKEFQGPSFWKLPDSETPCEDSGKMDESGASASQDAGGSGPLSEPTKNHGSGQACKQPDESGDLKDSGSQTRPDRGASGTASREQGRVA